LVSENFLTDAEAQHENMDQHLTIGEDEETKGGGTRTPDN